MLKKEVEAERDVERANVIKNKRINRREGPTLIGLKHLMKKVQGKVKRADGEQAW